MNKEPPIKHFPFAVFFVNNLIKKMKHLEPYRNDLISAAIIGLLEAEKRFDPSMGTKFITFASHYIKNMVFKEITNIQEKGLKKPHTEITKQIKINKAIKNNKNATYKEISEKTGIKEKRIKQILEDKKNIISLEEIIGENLRIEDTIGKDPTTELERELDREKLQKLIKKALSKLNEREMIVIKKRYLNEEKATLLEIGKELGISRERARQIEKKALKKMKSYMLKNNMKLNDFFYYI